MVMGPGPDNVEYKLVDGHFQRVAVTHTSGLTGMPAPEFRDFMDPAIEWIAPAEYTAAFGEITGGEQTMDFSHALHALKQGFRLARGDWPANRYVKLDAHDDFAPLKVHIETVGAWPYTPNGRELLAEDWRYHHVASNDVMGPRELPEETHGDGA